MKDDIDAHTGGCICGAIRFTVQAPMREVLACHCRECRRMSGHYFAATAARHENLEITENAGLVWYQSSAASRRGFCGRCGSSLFFDHGPDWSIGIAAGAFDVEPDLKLVAHIYIDEAGHYYEFADDAEKFDAAAWSEGGWQRFRGS